MIQVDDGRGRDQGGSSELMWLTPRFFAQSTRRTGLSSAAMGRRWEDWVGGSQRFGFACVNPKSSRRLLGSLG